MRNGRRGGGGILKVQHPAEQILRQQLRVLGIFLHGLRIRFMTLAYRIEVWPQDAVSRLGRFF